MTPTIVYGLPLSCTLRPIAVTLPPKRSCQKPNDSRTSLAVSDENSEPATGAALSIPNTLGVTVAVVTRVTSAASDSVTTFFDHAPSASIVSGRSLQGTYA